MSPPLIRKMKKKLAEELESTGESHPMSTSKRPRVDNMDMFRPRLIHFNPEIIVKIIWQLVKAKSYQNPYESERLGWEDDSLWQMIIDTLTLPIRVSVEDLKLTVLQYYRIYQKDVTVSELNLPETYLGTKTVEFVHQAFKNRRENVREYLSSFFCPSAPLAIELYRGSSSAGVLHGPGSSGMILPLQLDPSQHNKFAESLQLIKEALTDEELLWAEYEMTKYDAQMSLFCARSPSERIDFVKKGYARKKAKSIEVVQETQPMP